VQYERAIEAYKKANVPPNVRSFMGLARSYTALILNDNALEAYRQAFALDSTNRVLQIELGRMLQAFKKWDEAILRYKNLLTDDKDNAYLHKELGECYKGKGLIEQAIIEYEIARQLNPQSLRAYFELVALYNIQKAYISSLRVVDAGLLLFPKEPNLWRKRGDVLMLNGEYENSIAEYDKALALGDTTNVALYRAKGVANYMLMRPQEAVPAFEKMFQVDDSLGDNDELALFYYGYCLQATKQYDAALTQFNRIKNASNLFPETLSQIAFNMRARNDIEQTREYFEMAYKLNASKPEYLYYIAQTYDEAKSYRSAKKYYEQFVAIVKSDASFVQNAQTRLGELNRSMSKN
jgi:tetratricopeptide (TPR) repeat protein